MSEEKWRPVVGFEGLYKVSEYGVVRSLPRVTRVRGGGTRVLTGREIKTYPMSKGYVGINLVPREGVKHIRKTGVHRLVLEAFVGPQPDGYQGCHNDGDPTNNHVSNLRWDTGSANNYDTVKHGRHHYAKRSDCKYGHPLDGIFRWSDGSFKQRYCKTCFNGRARAKYAAKKQAERQGKVAA